MKNGMSITIQKCQKHDIFPWAWPTFFYALLDKNSEEIYNKDNIQ